MLSTDARLFSSASLDSELQFYPYKIAVGCGRLREQELLRQDFALRQAACETIIERPQDAIVVVSGTNPRELHQKPLNSE